MYMTASFAYCLTLHSCRGAFQITIAFLILDIAGFTNTHACTELNPFKSIRMISLLLILLAELHLRTYALHLTTYPPNLQPISLKLESLTSSRQNAFSKETYIQICPHHGDHI